MIQYQNLIIRAIVPIVFAVILGYLALSGASALSQGLLASIAFLSAGRPLVVNLANWFRVGVGKYNREDEM